MGTTPQTMPNFKFLYYHPLKKWLLGATRGNQGLTMMRVSQTWSQICHTLVMDLPHTGHRPGQGPGHGPGHRPGCGPGHEPGHRPVMDLSHTGHVPVINFLIGWLPIAPFQMLNFHQLLHSKVGLIIVKVPKAPLNLSQYCLCSPSKSLSWL